MLAIALLTNIHLEYFRTTNTAGIPLFHEKIVMYRNIYYKVKFIKI